MASANKVAVLRQREFFPCSMWLGQTVGNTAGAGLQSWGTGAPDFEEVVGSGIAGVTMGGVDSSHLGLFPTHWDRRNDIYVRPVWSSGNTASSLTWTFTYTALIPGTTALAVPNTALDTPWVAQSDPAVANSLTREPQGVLKGGSISDSVLYWAFRVASSTVVGSGTITLYGVEFEFTPKQWKGNIHEARAWTPV